MADPGGVEVVAGGGSGDEVEAGVEGGKGGVVEGGCAGGVGDGGAEVDAVEVEVDDLAGEGP